MAGRALRRILALTVVLGLTAVACGSGSPQVSRAPVAGKQAVPTTTTPPTTVPPATTTGPPAPPGVATGNPWPAPGAVTPGHHSILLMGDSLMGQTYFALPFLLSVRGFDATVYKAAIIGSGLLDTMNGLSPQAYFAQQLAAHPDVDTVVFEWAGACSDACAPGGPVVYGSSAYFAQWQAVAHALIGDAKQRGLTVVWAISPPPPPAPTDGSDPHWTLATQSATVLTWFDRSYPKSEGVTDADWWASLSDTTGAWQSVLWYNASEHTVRHEDGVHLLGDGAVRTATWTISALQEAWAKR